MQTLHRGARDVFHLGHGHEIAQVPEFHCACEGMPSTHAETRNIVFHKNTARSGCCGHEQNKKNGSSRVACERRSLPWI
jgi:hypothetical protein